MLLRAFFILSLIFTFCFVSKNYVNPLKIDNITSFYKETKLIYQPETLERFATVTETLVFILLNSEIIEDIKRIQNLSRPMINALKNLLNLFYEIRYALLSDNLVLSILPRVEDQVDPYFKVLAKYQQDLYNPWAAKISYNFANDILRKIIKRFDPNCKLCTRKLNTKSCVVDHLKTYLIDGSAPIFSNVDSKAHGFKLGVWFFFAKYVAYETERLLCENVYEKTGIAVDSLEDIHEKVTFDPEYKIPSRRSLITSKILFVKAPFIEFRKK